jgi:hypothetical protein
MGGFCNTERNHQMIVNPTSLATLREEWQGVVRMREHMRHLVLSTFAFDVRISPAFGHILYNLPLLLAFDVLNKVLLQARDEGRFISSGHRLGELIESAKSSVPWVDWQCLREGVKRRNEVTHNGKLFGDIQCLQDIADIESQLVDWGILRAA